MEASSVAWIAVICFSLGACFGVAIASALHSADKGKPVGEDDTTL